MNLSDKITPSAIGEDMSSVDVKQFIKEFEEIMKQAQMGLHCTTAGYHTISSLRDELKKRAGDKLI